jgi:hypothetical protein
MLGTWFAIVGERWGDADLTIPNVAECRRRLDALNRAN